jgi:hypothetical protein
METNGNTQNVENASVTLADGLHFVGDIDGFRIDLDAEESVGAQAPVLSPCAWCSSVWPDARRWT